MATPDRKRPKNLQIRGVNPFWIIESAEALFDQSDLPDNDRHLPMLPFQETIAILASLYSYTKIAAPSQSGKTATAELIAAVYAYAFPGTTTLILSTIADQSERLRSGIKDKLIARCRVPEMRDLSRDSDGMLELKCNKSKIIALPHSIKALTGNPANLVILDEMEKYDKDPGHLYSEAVARTGQKGGSLIIISSVDADGALDATQASGYRGSLFYTMLSKDLANRHQPDKDAIAARFTYHVSPFLKANIEKIRKENLNQPGGDQFFNAHYLSIPRKSKGRPVFSGYFDRKHHILSEQDIPLNPDDPLFLCFDPGLTKAGVLGQVDTDGVKLFYLRAWLGQKDQLLEDFVKSCVIKARKAFPHFEIQYFADVASNQQNRQTNLTDTDVIARVTGQYPTTKYQPISPGIQVMKSFMKRTNAFGISDACDGILADAFESGCVLPEQRAGVAEKEEYIKDGYYEHIADAARYPVFSICGGYTADSMAQNTEYSTQSYTPYYVDPVTGY